MSGSYFTEGGGQHPQCCTRSKKPSVLRVKGRKDYALRDLKAKFGLKPLVERRALVVSSEGMKPTKFDSMRKAAKAIGIGEGLSSLSS